LHEFGFPFVEIRHVAKAHVIVEARIGVALLANHKIVQMTIFPAHRNLENGV
jgi:hypothetical protein